MKPKIAIILASFLSSAALTAIISPATAENQFQNEVARTFGQITFNSSPVVQSDVNFAGDSRLPDVPPFSWKQGDKLAEVFPIGLLKLAGGTNFSPAAIATELGIDKVKLLEGKLGNFKFLVDMPLKDLLKANPQLKNLRVNLIPGWTGGVNSTLGQLALNPLFGSKPLPTAVLNAAKIKVFSGLIDTPYFNYPNIESLAVNKFFGLADVGLDKVFGIGIGNEFNGLQLLKLDRIATQEANIGKINRDNVSSGSNKEPYAPCDGGLAQAGSSNTCDYVEFKSVLFPNIRDNRLNGTKSIIGQQLKGGEGLLGQIMTAAGVREPAGYIVPYIGIKKCGSKWSAGSPDPRTGTVTQYLNLRFCYRTLFGFQASPYFIPLPIGTASEKDNTQLLPMKVEPQASIPLTTQISQIVSNSDLPDAQKNYIKSTANLIISQNPSGEIDSILSQSVIASFGGKALKTNSFNPILGSTDEIVKFLL